MGKLFTITIFLCMVFNVFGSKIKLSDIQTLTLYNGRMTSGRRSSPVPQITCIGGTARAEYNPMTIQCTNKGTDGYDIQWECNTDLDNSFRFGQTSVTCEGYDYPNDPYILVGSCGVEYTLYYTKDGIENESYDIFDYLSVFIFILIISSCLSPSYNYPTYSSGSGWLSGFGIGTFLGSTYSRSSNGWNNRTSRTSRSIGTRTARGFGGTRRR